MKLPAPIRASDVTKHDHGRRRAVKNRRAVWQVWYAMKHELFWIGNVIKTEWRWFRREWFRWIEK